MNNFKYWFAHWCAFQMVALNLKSWRFRFLFHDVEKPFLLLFLPHKLVSRIHRKLNRHHVEFIFPKYYDKLGMIIDWECARFTKEDKQLDAWSTMLRYYPQLCNLLTDLFIKLNLKR